MTEPLHERIAQSIFWGAGLLAFVALTYLTVWAMSIGAVLSWFGIAGALLLWLRGGFYTLQKLVETAAPGSWLELRLHRFERKLVALATPRDWAGSWTALWLGEVPVQLHWTLPIGLFAWSGFHFEPQRWAAIALILVVHEAGHLALVRLSGLVPKRIVLHGAGGECAWSGQATPVRRSMIAWGGVLAQAVLLGLAWVGGAPHNLFVRSLIETNGFLILINLVPIAPLDGAEAWRLIPRLLMPQGQEAPRKQTRLIYQAPDTKVLEARAEKAKRDRYLS